MADGSKLTHVELLKQLSTLSAYKTQLLQQLASPEHHLDNSSSNIEPPQPQISLPTTIASPPSTCHQVRRRTFLFLSSYRRHQQPPESHFTTVITMQTNHPHLHKTQPLSQIHPIFIHLRHHHHHIPQQFRWTPRRPTRHGSSKTIRWRILDISIRLMCRQNHMADPSPPHTMCLSFPRSDGVEPMDSSGSLAKLHQTIDVHPDIAALQTGSDFVCEVSQAPSDIWGVKILYKDGSAVTKLHASVNKLVDLQLQIVKVAAELSPNEFTCLKFVDLSTILYAHIMFDQIPEPAWCVWNTMLLSSTPCAYPILTISLSLGIWVRSWLKLFDQMPYRYIAIWNAVIIGCVTNGYAIKCEFIAYSYLHICLLDVYEKCAAIGKGFAIGFAASVEHEIPFTPVLQLSGVQTILDNWPSANRIHLVDLGTKSGSHGTIVMQALTVRTEYPVEHLKIIAVGTYRRRLEMTGERLLSFAQTMKLPFSFSFKLVASDMKELKKDLFALETGEALAIYSELRLGSMLSCLNHLETLLGVINSVKPCVMVVVEAAINTNQLTFLDRFFELLFSASAYFDYLETCMEQDNQFRIVAENVYLRATIQNVITVEGEERIHRHEKIEFWRALFARFGLVETELGESSLYQANLVIK